MQPLVSDPTVESETNPFRFQMVHLIKEGAWAIFQFTSDRQEKNQKGPKSWPHEGVTPKANPTFYCFFVPNFLPYFHTHFHAFIYNTFFKFTLSSPLSSMQYLLIGIGFRPWTIYRVWILLVEKLDWSYWVTLCESSNNRAKKCNLFIRIKIIYLVDSYMSGTRL